MYGRSKTASSRFAEPIHAVTASPALIFSPRISTSLLARRIKCVTGDDQRSASSTAEDATMAAGHRPSPLFISASAMNVALITCEVVTTAPSSRLRQFTRISSSFRRRPSTSIVTR